jgi:hypothetical protein
VTRPGRSSQALRRYPALLGGLAWCLAALLLPSSLTLPQTGPPTLAEFAPVPGQSGQASPIAALDGTSSAGVGAGGTAGGGGGTQASTTTAIAAESAGGGRRRPGTKRCVGRPPRQTEDVLSPPCIAFFEGDNFGSTAKGVTRDEIRVAFLGTCAAAGGVQIGDLDDSNDPQYHAATAGYFKYFNDRFQTYGRRVHGYSVRQPCNTDADTVINEVDERIQPFAFLQLNEGEDFAVGAAQRGIIANWPGGDRTTMHDHAPFIISYPPDQDDLVSIFADFVCMKLAGRNAIYSGEPTDHGKRRRFALYYDREDKDAQRRGVEQTVRAIGDRCGEAAGPISPSNGAHLDHHSQDATRWRVEGVTTVLEFGGRTNGIMQAAEATGWHPEWAHLIEYCCNSDYQTNPPAPQMRNSLGVWYERRWPEDRADHDWHRAMREGCGCDGGTVAVYRELFLLFRGLQAAGPRLTPDNFDRGLHAIPQQQSPDPWTPAAYFAPSNHSLIKDVSVIRWDALGQARGSTKPGCWRLVEHGKRYRSGDFASHPGDGDFDTAGWPCSGEP